MRKSTVAKFINVLLMFAYTQSISGITLVYNMRIRRAFNYNLQDVAISSKKSHIIFSIVPIIYSRDSHIVNQETKADFFDNRLIGGAIFNIRYKYNRNWWLEVTTGAERERSKTCGTLNSNCARSGLDDIVLASGYNFYPTDKIQFVLFGLSGFPTKRSVDSFEAPGTLVGTRFFSLAIGSEFSYSFTNTLEKSLVFIFQNRFLHFFNRNWFPILPCDAEIQPGNATDLLLTLQYRRLKNMFEIGYNPTFFTNQAVIFKDRKVEDETFVRHGAYCSYAILFKKLPWFSKPGLIGAGISFSRTKKFDAKTLSGWLNLTVVF